MILGTRHARAFARFLTLIFAAAWTFAATAAPLPFGSDPLQDVKDAAASVLALNAGNANCPQPPTKNQLAALTLSVTWHESTGEGHTPSPMTLGRHDNDADFYYNRSKTGPYRRAFWHPGVGAWQLDDGGLGKSTGYGRFGTKESSLVAAAQIYRLFCANPGDENDQWQMVLGDWIASCPKNNFQCARIYSKIYQGDQIVNVEPDVTTHSWGGTIPGTCKLQGKTGKFPCYFVDPANAEPIGDVRWTTSPSPAADPPLALPFYVYTQVKNKVTYEVRHWMSLDTGYGFDISAWRVLSDEDGKGQNSRGGLKWLNTQLCDVTSDSTIKGHCDSTKGVQQLVVSISGSGSGTVVSNPAGIDYCNGDCSAFFPTGGTVTLSASPDSSSVFDGWDGACKGVATCTLNMNAVKSVSATFSPGSCTNGRAKNLSSRSPDSSSASACPLPPFATTGIASSVTATSATVNGAVNPKGYATTAHFEWGTTSLLGSSTTSIDVGGGDNDVPLSSPLAGLAPSTTYYFRVIASNSVGTSNGDLSSFTTDPSGSPPTIVTTGATNITSIGGTMNGTVNPNGSDTTVHFDWGATASYGNSTGSYDAGSGISLLGVQASIFNSPANTTYHYRLVGSSDKGTVYGGDLSFTTAPGQSNRVQNSGFESGSSIWVQHSSSGINPITSSTAAHGRNGSSWYAWFGAANGLTEYIYQDIWIPANATKATIDFWYQISTSETSSSACFDKLDVQIRKPSDGSVQATLKGLCNLNATSSWTDPGPFDVTAYAGQTIRLYFASSTDGTLPSSFFIDDVTLSSDGN